MQTVVELYIKNVNPTAIAKQVGIRRVDVLHYIEEWKKASVGSEVMRDRVEELIATLNDHYSILIQKSYEVIEEVDMVWEGEDEEAYKRYEKKWGTMSRAQMLSQKMSAIKTIADLESKRIDVLQKAGLLEAADLGDELAQMEEEKAIIARVLRDDLCPVCKPKVLGALVGVLGGGQTVTG